MPSQVPNPGVDCSAQVLNATLAWLSVGGRRIDSGDSYENMQTMGQSTSSQTHWGYQNGANDRDLEMCCASHTTRIQH